MAKTSAIQKNLRRIKLVKKYAKKRAAWKKIINNKKKLHLPPETLKHFSNVFTRIIMDWNLNFNDDLKKLSTTESTEIKGK